MMGEAFSAFYGEFGVTALFNGSRQVQGLFYRASSQALDLAGRQPRFRCVAAAVPSPVGKSLAILGETFTIRAAEPDGNGETMLILES